MRHLPRFGALALLATLPLAAHAGPAPRPGLDSPGLPIVRVQSDPRVPALEEQVRLLNGRIEELNFQILQMQDQMRKLQEDLEFRLEQIEGGSKQGKAEPATPAQQDTAAAMPSVSPDATDIADDAARDAAAAPAEGEATSEQGAPPRVLGTITFDANGNPTGGAIEPGDGAVSDAGEPAADDTDKQTVAALPHMDNAEDLYRASYQFILAGDYPTAEAGFREFADRFPKDQRASDAQYWLGEALFGQERYRDAAEVFLAANKAYPKARKAPDSLLKLGVSLAAMGQRDVACATFEQVGKRYPDASEALVGRVRQEQALAGC